ncbi:hypothetical protein GPK89_12890 [Gemmiger formicilis]|nr:hypothetical protein [Gemmiger formicilis]MBT9675606.1 hypothetical protein [Gemmiger formicilis]
MKICAGERFGKEAVNGITVYPMQVSAVETAALRWMRTMAAATEYE